MDRAEALKVVEVLTRRAQGSVTLERLLTSRWGFGLENATPLQRAICRIADGLPLGGLAGHADVVQSIGAIDFAGRPKELTILSGTRTAKSMIAAALAVRASQTCDVSHLARGEMPRYAIVSLRKDLADVVFGHIKGTVLSQPSLRTLLLEEPTADTVLLRHPTGRPIEIKVVAGSKAGATLVARWLIGIAFDEFTRMVGADDGVVNHDEMRASVLSRLLPGAMVTNIGSPWAPFGPAYDQAQKFFGQPSQEIVVVWAKADKMNPGWWTPERAAELRAKEPDAYRTDYLAQFLEPEELFFPASLIEAATRKEPEIVPRQAGHTYFAAMDPATRGNAWTLVVGTRNGSKRIVSRATQWVPGGTPLNPEKIFEEAAVICAAYGVKIVKTDQWAVDALRPLAAAQGLTLVQQDLTGPEHYEAYKTAQTWLTLGQLELAPVPALIDDLKRVKRRVTQAGLSVVLPHTADGRHCDYAPALVRMLTSLAEDYRQPAPPKDTAERADFEAARIEQDEDEDFTRRQRNTPRFLNIANRARR